MDKMNLEKSLEYHRIKSSYYDMLLQKANLEEKLKKLIESIEVQAEKIKELETKI